MDYHTLLTWPRPYSLVSDDANIDHLVSLFPLPSGWGLVGGDRACVKVTQVRQHPVGVSTAIGGFSEHNLVSRVLSLPREERGPWERGWSLVTSDVTKSVYRVFPGDFCLKWFYSSRL